MMRFWTRCTVTCISVCLAVTALPGNDIVLCLGPHGHIALEFAQNGRCDEGPCRPIGETPQTPGVNSNDHVCGDCLSCVDIPLAQGPVVSPSSSNGMRKKSASPTNLAMSAVLPPDLAPNLFGAVRCASLSPPDDGGPSCAPSRILRI